MLMFNTQVNIELFLVLNIGGHYFCLLAVWFADIDWRPRCVLKVERAGNTCVRQEFQGRAEMHEAPAKSGTRIGVEMIWNAPGRESGKMPPRCVVHVFVQHPFALLVTIALLSIVSIVIPFQNGTFPSFTDPTMASIHFYRIKKRKKKLEKFYVLFGFFDDYSETRRGRVIILSKIYSALSSLFIFANIL